MKDKIIVIGGGGHAKVIISIIKKLKNFEIVGYTDLENKGSLLGIIYLGIDDNLYNLSKNGIRYAALGIGQIKSTFSRERVVQNALEVGFIFPPIISPNSILNEEVEIGNGTVVMDGVVINCGTRIGDYSIINTNSSIDHDCKIGSFTHIAPGVTLSGGVQIGNRVLVGTGSNVIQQVTIADNSIISAGSSVQKSITIPGIYRGVPAELIKEIS